MSVLGYARVSTGRQGASLDAQRAELVALGAEKVFTDTISGVRSDRPGFDALMGYLRDHDQVVVTRLDRLGRSASDTIRTVHDLAGRGVRVRALDLDLDTGTAAGRMVLGVMAVLAEWERDLLVERTREGLDHARRQGTRLGRPPALSPEQKAAALTLLDQGMSAAGVARSLGVSNMTVLRLAKAHGDRRRADSKPSAGMGAGDHDEQEV